MHAIHSRAAALPLFLNLLACIAAADVNYVVDDGSSELGFGIDPGEDMIWFNRFAVEPGGEIIDRISVVYGRPGGVSPLNGLPVSILLYEDTNGGSPQDGVLLQTLPATVANGNTNTFNDYAISPTLITGDLLVGVLFRNQTTINRFIGAVDRTAPSSSNQSFAGWGINLDPANLAAIPAGQFNPLEGFGTVGNFLIGAHGTPVPEPSAAALFVALALFHSRYSRGYTPSEHRTAPFRR